MNPNTPFGTAAEVPWPTSNDRMDRLDRIDEDDRMSVPDTSMLPGDEPSPTSLAHEMERAEPAVRHLRDELRNSVRGNPLACMAAAFALGVVVARIAR